MASSGNVLSFKPPGFNQTLHVKFPDSRLAVCEKCKKNYKTRDMCRVRNNHTDAPWSTAYICITLDDSCTDSNNKLINKPFSVKLNQWHPYCAKKAFNAKTPVCAACKKTNRTRSFCRERHQHKQLPWCAVYVVLSCPDESSDSKEENETKEQVNAEQEACQNEDDNKAESKEIQNEEKVKNEESSTENKTEDKLVTEQIETPRLKLEEDNDNETSTSTSEHKKQENCAEELVTTKTEDCTGTKSTTASTTEETNDDSGKKEDNGQDKENKITSVPDTLASATLEAVKFQSDGNTTKQVNGKKSESKSEKAENDRNLAESDDINKIDESRTLLAQVSCKNSTIQWLDLADFDSMKNSPYIFPNGQTLSNQRPPIMTGAMQGMSHPYYPPMVPIAGFAHQQAMQMHQQHFLQMQQRQQQFVAQQAVLQNQFPMLLGNGQQNGAGNNFLPPAPQGQNLPVPSPDVQQLPPEANLQAPNHPMQNQEPLASQEDNSVKKQGDQGNQQQQAQIQAQWQAQMLYQQQIYQQQFQIQQQSHSNSLIMQQPGGMMNQQFAPQSTQFGGLPQFQQMQTSQQMIPNQSSHLPSHAGATGVDGQLNSSLQPIQQSITSQPTSDPMQGASVFTNINPTSQLATQSLNHTNLLIEPLQTNAMMTLPTNEKNHCDLKRKQLDSEELKKKTVNGNTNDIDHNKKAKI